MTAAGFDVPAWQHDFLYRIFAHHLSDYPGGSGTDDRHDYQHHLARRVFEVLRIAVEPGAPEEHAGEIWDILGPASLETFPDVVPTLETLKARDYRLIIISNWQSGLEHFCTDLGLAGYFEAILSSADEGVAKPDPRIFRSAAERLGVSTGEMLHIGDSPTDDYAGGSLAGCRVVLLDRGAAEWPGRVKVPDLAGFLEWMEAM
jgi:putative hydrolase of the HAD superfamily